MVALTGYGAAGDLSETSAAGFAAHLVKPADPTHIHEMLGQALQARRAGSA